MKLLSLHGLFLGAVLVERLSCGVAGGHAKPNEGDFQLESSQSPEVARSATVDPNDPLGLRTKHEYDAGFEDDEEEDHRRHEEEYDEEVYLKEQRRRHRQRHRQYGPLRQ